jgi:hypothetical protein
MLVVRHTLHHRDLLTVPAYVRVWDSRSRHKIMGYGFPRATDKRTSNMEKLAKKQRMDGRGYCRKVFRLIIREDYSAGIRARV